MTADAPRPDSGLKDEQCVVLPAGTDILPLARAWFTESEWLREPKAGRQVAATVGARFRGSSTVQEEPEPGELRLSWATRLVGPLGTDALPSGVLAELPAGARGVFRVERDPRADSEPRVDAWLRAAARRAGGAVVDGSGAVEVPEPDSGLALAVYSPVPLAPEITLGLVRTVAPMARLESLPLAEEGIASYSLILPTQFDGTIEVNFFRASELPLCLLQLDWREYGPFAYRARWTAAAETQADADHSWLRIARRRVSPLMARSVFAIRRAVEGVVVDEDGFLVTPERLAERASAF